MTDAAGAAGATGSRARRGVSFAEALRFWFKLGWISFGGPAGQIAVMHKEIVERRRWLGEGRFLHAAIVVEAVLRIGVRALKGRAHFLIAAFAFAGIYFLRVPFPVIVLLAALVGLVGERLRPEAFGAQVKADGDDEAAAKKDDEDGRTPRSRR
ncbi:MAG TPA: chromate transporter [Pyrinomonadaceae bacterium]|nr:chromate transporter [Pyrinomonadaceae bacterium]